MASCASCGAALETPLVCNACGALQTPDPAPDPFAVFGLEPSIDVNQSSLERLLILLTRRMHPDYFGRDPAKRAQAERNTATLNSSYKIVSDLFRRSDWIVRDLGGPEDERQMSPQFLAEVLEWNEVLEAAREGEAEAIERLPVLENELRERRAERLSKLDSLLTPRPVHGSPVLREARRELNAVRYLDRTLEELAALRSAEPAG